MQNRLLNQLRVTSCSQDTPCWRLAMQSTRTTEHRDLPCSPFYRVQQYFKGSHGLYMPCA